MAEKKPKLPGSFSMNQQDGMATQENAFLLLEDGTLVEGTAIGKKGTTGGEICFNTGMTGYQEIYTDPSYYGQIMINTVTHIGNYGTKLEEQEHDEAMIAGLVVDKFSPMHSRRDADASLQDFLLKHGVTGIADVDTRQLVRQVRSKGAMNAVISSELSSREELEAALRDVPPMANLELSSQVTCKEPYTIGPVDAEFHVAVLDLGIKQHILRSFAERGIRATVYPAKTPFEEMEKGHHDGYFVSNGPGDPKAMDYAVKTAISILDSNKPAFGICLGQQIFALAENINTFKMHHGHRGINHPVKNLLTGKGEITSQNHGFCVDRDSLEKSGKAVMTHVHLNDHTVAGMRFKDKPVFCVQYHPESNPGPHDSRYLIDEFVSLMRQHAN